MTEIEIPLAFLAASMTQDACNNVMRFLEKGDITVDRVKELAEKLAEMARKNADTIMELALRVRDMEKSAGKVEASAWAQDTWMTNYGHLDREGNVVWHPGKRCTSDIYRQHNFYGVVERVRMGTDEVLREVL